MNTIRNYINAMFSTLPKTPEMLRLQAEMLENLEEKYNDLLASGKNESEAIGIVLADVGSAEELRAGLGIKPEEQPVYDMPNAAQNDAFLEEYRAFHKRFAAAMAGGVMLCIAGIILGGAADEWFHNDAITCVCFFVPIAFGVALFIYYGIQEDGYEQRMRMLGMNPDGSPADSDAPKRKSLSALLSAILFPIAALFYVFVLGMMFGLWHPGWVIFPICAVAVGAVEAYDNYRDMEK